MSHQTSDSEHAGRQREAALVRECRDFARFIRWCLFAFMIGVLPSIGATITLLPTNPLLVTIVSVVETIVLVLAFIAYCFAWARQAKFQRTLDTLTTPSR